MATSKSLQSNKISDEKEQERQLKKFSRKIDSNKLKMKLLEDYKSLVNGDDDDPTNQFESDSFFNNL